MRPSWFPDWTGQNCVIIASGPSASESDIALARDRAKFIAVNNSWKLAPWADILYGCDYQWWRLNEFCPEFEGLKICGQKRASEERDEIASIEIRAGDDRMLFDQPGVVGWGGNSGFHALNLAIQFGAKRIVLVGFDMTLANGIHWHGSHPKQLHNPPASTVLNWRRVLDGAAPDIKARGVEVVNASRQSALQAYEKMDFAEAMAWLS